MDNYKIKIIERLAATMLVETDNVDTALERVREMYRNSEIILTAENYVDTEITAVENEPSDDIESEYDYICDCGHTRFTAKQISYSNVIVKGKDIFNIDEYASGQPFGPYACVKCGRVYGKLPVRETQNK